jgi:DNA-directed RNA polymerase subunit RPC12/RpoP
MSMYPKAVCEIPENNELLRYWNRVKCTNCGLERSLAFFLGVLIKDHACPGCGNKTLEKAT